MATTNFNTQNNTFRQLMGNGLMYHIPRFQRDYSWSEEEWDDLWADIQGIIHPDGEPAHYMGYLVLQTQDNKEFEVIDGQQRLTTLSLIVLAGMRILHQSDNTSEENNPNRRRLEQLRSSYIGYLDPITLLPRSKLTLNRNNDAYYQKYLVTLADHLPQRGFSASTHKLRKAFEWLARRLETYIKDFENPGVAIAQFVETISDRLFFTVITVDDELNAYKVFETLNARGVRLSSTDLLKNYLFSVLFRAKVDSEELNQLENRWEDMVGRLGSESFPDFLRMHWNSRRAFARQTELFKVIRRQIVTRENVFDLLRAMDEDIDTYLALTQPDGSGWPEHQRSWARELRMFSVRQPFPMLMAAKRRLSDLDYESLLRASVILSFRYNVIGAQNPNEQEHVYSAAALGIAKGELASANAILESLRKIYVSDNAFRSAFVEKSIKTAGGRNARIVRYILGELERQSGGVDIDYASPDCTIEHILPRNAPEHWEHFSDSDLDVFTYRLGNMTILEANLNRDASNGSFSEKAAIYQKSRFSITRRIGDDYPDWTTERIRQRQSEMAKMATSIWRIDNLS